MFGIGGVILVLWRLSRFVVGFVWWLLLRCCCLMMQLMGWTYMWLVGQIQMHHLHSLQPHHHLQPLQAHRHYSHPHHHAISALHSSAIPTRERCPGHWWRRELGGFARQSLLLGRSGGGIVGRWIGGLRLFLCLCRGLFLTLLMCVVDRGVGVVELEGAGGWFGVWLLSNELSPLLYNTNAC